MSICWLIITDGRDQYHEPAIKSLWENLPSPDYMVRVEDPQHKLGFAGAIQQGWTKALETDCTHLVHFEADFTFNRPVPLADMVDVLDTHPHLVQMALLRQPWNERERAAGGIVQLAPESYERRSFGEHVFLEHTNFVTTNPCVWPRWVLQRGWPQRSQSEGHFGIDLFAGDRALRAAFWGDGSESVRHIGDIRCGRGY